MRKFLDELKDFFKKGDMTLLILALIVAGFGCVCMASATSAEKFGDSNLKYIVVQLLAIGLGVFMLRREQVVDNVCVACASPL